MSFKRKVWEAQNSARGWDELNISLPSWLEEWRPNQLQALEQLEDGYVSRGLQVQVVDAPPGSGKTVIGEAARVLWGGRRNLYVCHSKALQDQFCRDFPYSKVIKGRANYPTEIFVDAYPEISCADCTKQDGGCEFCETVEGCPYELAKQDALGSDVAVLNTAYFLTEANYVGSFGECGFVVLDECDLLEKELMGFVEARVSQAYVSKYKLGEPKFKTKEESWKEWLDGTVLPVLKSEAKQGKEFSDDVRGRRAWLNLRRRIEELGNVSRHLGTDGDGAWVAEVDKAGWTFKPVEVKDYGERLIWKHSKRFLLMSGSVVSTSSLMNSLGFSGESNGIVVPSSFAPSSRKVRILPTGSLSRKSSKEEWDAVFTKLCGIVGEHTDDRILVHTVSHSLAEKAGCAVKEEIQRHGGQRPVYRVEGYTDRERVIADWLESRAGVFLSPSMDRGVDLKGDLCRVQVILKVPFPSLGDKQVERRLYGTKGGRLWYAVETARSLIQMSGRVVRSEEDWGVTYVLDSEFLRFWRQWKGLFPQWWIEGLQFR